MGATASARNSLELRSTLFGPLDSYSVKYQITAERRHPYSRDVRLDQIGDRTIGNRDPRHLGVEDRIRFRVSLPAELLVGQQIGAFDDGIVLGIRPAGSQEVIPRPP